MKIVQLFLLATVCFFVLSSCDNSKEDFTPVATVAQYAPTTVGKYVIYRLDSTVFTQSGGAIEIHKYQIKHTISDATTDAAGNTTLTVQRHIRNEAGTDGWKDYGYLRTTVFANKIETVENNLRVVNVAAPIYIGAKWKGHAFFPPSPYLTLFPEMTTAFDVNTWEFKYTAKADTTIGNTTYNNVLTIEQNNETTNFPITPNTAIASKQIGFEKYAPNVGLIYKDFQLIEFQKQHAGDTDNYEGFGITMWAIEHN